MSVNYFLKRTKTQLKLDVDKTTPAWRRLATILNFLHLFPDAKIERKGEAYHLYAPTPSSWALRAALGDCRGRLLFSEITDSDIIFKWKGVIKFKKVKGRIRPTWVQKPQAYEPCDIHDILKQPYWNFKYIAKKKRGD